MRSAPLSAAGEKVTLNVVLAIPMSLLGTIAAVFAALAWLSLSFQAILLGAAWVGDREVALEAGGEDVITDADVVLSVTALTPAQMASLKKGAPLAGTLLDGEAEIERAGFAVDYLEARHAETLARIKEPEGNAALARTGNP